MRDVEHVKVLLNIYVKNIDELLSKAKKYVGLLKEAKTLAEELASVEYEVEIM
ncbi:hypothetical protein HYG86_09285 [Alkalicella caledoniensis]|uniref:Uncharacterized protein n=1 Tax=Alkalicella caledoniensis TaxID=2731377 RepID=A0A7G9W8E2_ALKCA|nr:hypothetical protein [Alkalicella caledoniensis]QNO14954.1 hypothetical protein HYG86_09285 [Alkalicella caledoniensis]